MIPGPADEVRPWVATHYFRGDRRPFQSLSDVEDSELESVLDGLVAGSRRRFGPRYVSLRRATEAAAREELIAAGGRPGRAHPHYFVLGESPWFAGLYDDPREVRLPLTAFPPDVTSFTWTDSITALGLGRDLGVPQPEEEWERHVYRLDAFDLDRAARLERASAPASYDGYQARLLDHYVEIQLWSDAPVAAYL